MEREHTLKLVGKNSSEIFLLRYPTSLTDFSEFDFSFFAQGAIDVCNEALKTGNPDFDRIADLRKDFQVAHVYIEHNIRTVYEKIVYDCWIDYVCRRDNIGTSALWNRFINCKTPFEKAIFARLCEFRYNRAVNEWLNVIRLQDYANTKMDFIFIDGLSSRDDAAARRNYFDLMFSVTAQELGCKIEELGMTKVFAVGRAPTAPFMFPNISKEIVRHVLEGFDYSDDYSDIGDYTDISDQIAMDAFSRMKSGLPQELSSYSIVRGKMEKYFDKIYMPCTLKAVIDLEIDAIIEEGSWLARCKRCKRYFLRSEKHPEEYCQRFIPGGKTCLELFEEENPRPKMTPELEARCREVTDEMYSRVDKDMSVKEYEAWHGYLLAMQQKVDNGEITPGELENFLKYSLEVDITKSHPIVEVEKKEPEPQEAPTAPKERVVKPFMPERISRDSIADKQETQPEEPPEQEEPPRERPPKDGFFTSPSVVSRKKNERTQVSHVIRNGESRGEARDITGARPAGFQPFGADLRNIANTASAEEARPRNPLEDFKRLEEQIEEGNRIRREMEEARDRRYSAPQDPSRAEPRYYEPEAYQDPRRAEPRYSEPNDRAYPQDAARGGNMRGDQREYGRGYDYREPGREDYREQGRGYGRELPREDYREQGRGYGRELPREDYREQGRGYGREEARYPEQRVSDQGSGQVFKPFEQPDFADFSRDLSESRTPAEELSQAPKIAEIPENPENIQNSGPSAEEPAEPPRPRVIRKNAAAISAYGKAAGATFAAPEAVSRTHITDSAPFKPEPSEAPEALEASAPPQNTFTPEIFTNKPVEIPEPDPEPFKDIGSIFDVLASSENGGQDSYSGRADRPKSANISDASVSERSAEPPSPVRTPPRGFWTEDRGLFANEDDPDDADGEEALSEPEVKEKKHAGKSSKTQRLFDAIMREPDNNPNFRRK